MTTNSNAHLSLRFLLLVGFVVASLFFTLRTETVSVAAAADSAAPSPTPTPDEEMDRLKREADLSGHRATKAENEKRIAEAQKAELEARFPKASTSPLAGTTTVEGAVIESQIISYQALKNAADTIVEKIHTDLSTKKTTECSKEEKDQKKEQPTSDGTENESKQREDDSSKKDDESSKKEERECDRNTSEHPRLAIFNERDVNLILSYRVAQAQIEIIAQGYKSLLKKQTTGTGGLRNLKTRIALSAAESFLGAFVDLTAFLRTNVEIKGQTFVIDEGPLVAEVFRAAREVKDGATNKMIPGELYYPYVFPVNAHAKTNSKLLAQLEDTRDLRVLAEKLLGELVKAITDLEEARKDEKLAKKVVDVDIPTKTSAALVQAGNIIKAHCPALNAEVEKIKAEPKETQPERMKNLIERARKECRRMSREKLETLLGIKETLNQLGEDLKKANDDLKKATDNVTDVENTLKDLQKKLNLGTTNSTDLAVLKEHAENAISRLKAINAQFDSLIAALIQNEAGSPNALTNYIRIERLLSVLCKCDFWLQLKVINAGGNNRIKTNLIADIFRGGNRVSHSGGVIAEYHLFNSDGQSIRSGVVTEYRGYVDSKKIPTNEKAAAQQQK